MKRTFALFLTLAMLALAGSAFAVGPWRATAVITGGVVTDNTSSAAVQLPTAASIYGKQVKTLWVKVPASMTSSTFYVTVAGPDAPTTFKPFYAYNNGTNIINGVTAGSTGDFIFQVPGDVSAFTAVKVTCGTGQAANHTFVIYGY